MVVVLKGDTVLTKGVPKVIFTASPAQLPGFFGGKISANDITDAGDTVNMKLEVKYDTGDPFEDGENRDFIKTDKIARLTPVEENFGYQVTLELLSSSTSATVTLGFVITRSAV